MEHLISVLELLKEGKVAESDSNVKVYEKSFTEKENVKLVMVNEQDGKWILAVGDGELYKELNGKDIKGLGKACPLSHENRLVLNNYFTYTVPQAFGTKVATMGLGDRLGLASPGHIQTLRNRKVKPILAQQSIRELTLTNRTMIDILDAASFAVFQEGYKDGYGADGDHIKEEKDIAYALSLGISFLTLDCSDHIPNQIESASDSDVRADYEKLPQETKDYFNEIYLNQSFDVDGLAIKYDEIALMKNVLLYGGALNYTEHVYKSYITEADKAIDFEISIDETETITSPDAHFFVANELKRRQVSVTSLAPRFCGEFQKGIDYIGDMKQFEKELSEHASIAEYFGYKLSIHSGSDKFSVFPIIGEYTKGVLHIKTAGTNWLEAVRVIANTNPDLYRKMHIHAEEHFEETLKYYHVTPDLKSIAPLEITQDADLPNYMDNDAARQLFHVTYGILLTATDEQGNFLFKDEFFKTLNEKEETYSQALVKHIGKHVDLLGL
ncbi:tagaturonate epimerase family protein [Aquibacillus rhizosphaerae]|uniref:Tagaturonate/fructuronate epimerase n=1 Tax=Aquibacillus rhizosphaerae TaxID=3051431 RepID=A0ABT7L350_9BACI|nr:tagaturonate epimerase family protein [Aquibacillus sp. LR5S19]MDL4840293.1 tagaturonate epimerase family protein [Aquibacillus sp. LR5S19]